MNDKSKLVKLFVGTQSAVHVLAMKLEDQGIRTSVASEFEVSVGAGFGAGSPTAIDVYINDTDLEKANAILEEFLSSQEEE